MPLDLKQPGGKEMVIVGGVALGGGLIYLWLQKPKAATAPSQSAGTNAVAADGAPFSGSGLRVAGGYSTGNALTDANVATPVSTPASPTGIVTTSARAKAPRLPVLHTTQGAGEILGTGQSASSLNAGSPNIGGVAQASSGPVSPAAAQVYNALTKLGLQPYQAAGIMGNIQNESSFRTEVSAMDTNGKLSNGLIQWNEGTYPNSGQYVTGNFAKDFANQITAIVGLFKQHGIGGTTAGAVAGNWASQVEGCAGCQPGGVQYNARVANAQVIYANILAGKYKPVSKVVPTGGTNQFPGGLAAARKKYDTTPQRLNAANLKRFLNGANGVRKATSKQIAQLFPIVKPKAKPVSRQAVATSRAQQRRGVRAV